MSAYRECRGKATYYHRHTAERVRRRLEGKKGEELRAYACRWCGHYHLTSELVGPRRKRSREHGEDRMRGR